MTTGRAANGLSPSYGGSQYQPGIFFETEMHFDTHNSRKTISFNSNKTNYSSLHHCFIWREIELSGRRL